ncbi:sensor histidine kinase [uncultured Amnibacterium sp.]|uniref:sensor histidine kinase n=1 Tax=uncultured Amnibacterium sp. TaxID=1631851 RepID=UPI0035CC5E44
MRSVRRAALRTAWQVTAVSTGLVVGILGLAALFVLDQSRPTELLERPKPGESKIYVDSHEVLVALIVLGVAAVAIVGFASWGISRRAVTPIGAALRMQRAFVADASHELRTPLTVLDTRVQLLDRRLARGEPYAETLAAARRDTRTMIDVVADLLLVAEASATDAGTSADLRPTVLSSAEDLRLLATERRVRVEAVVANEGRVGLSEPSLRRSLVVLIDNAVAHTPDGGVVRVDARVERGTAIVRVQDTGPGITGIDVDQVFERFAHGAETGQRRGFGIGLSLVRDLAVRHGGRVLVESTSGSGSGSGSGTTMRLELPLVR